MLRAIPAACFLFATSLMGCQPAEGTGDLLEECESCDVDAAGEGQQVYGFVCKLGPSDTSLECFRAPIDYGYANASLTVQTAPAVEGDSARLDSRPALRKGVVLDLGYDYEPGSAFQMQFTRAYYFDDLRDDAFDLNLDDMLIEPTFPGPAVAPELLTELGPDWVGSDDFVFSVPLPFQRWDVRVSDRAMDGETLEFSYEFGQGGSYGDGSVDVRGDRDGVTIRSSLLVPDGQDSVTLSLSDGPSLTIYGPSVVIAEQDADGALYLREATEADLSF
jgi:hypothetical protein